MKRGRYTLLSWGTIAGILLLWYGVTALGLVKPFMLPSPGDLGREFLVLVAQGYAQKPLREHILSSLARTFAGLGFGLAVGIPLGLLMGASRTLYAILSPVFSFMRPIPPIAFIPLMILYFGIGEFSKVFLIFMAALWYVVLNASAGVRAVPRDLLRAAQNLGLSIAAQAGLGFMVMDAATFFRVPDVYIGIIIIGLIGLTLEAITRALEVSFLHWQGR